MADINAPAAESDILASSRYMLQKNTRGADKVPLVNRNATPVSQCPQVAQWPPPHDPHPDGPPLATKRLPPPASRLTAANKEMTRCPAISAQRGQAAGLSDWLMGRNISKRASQLLHSYSYSGIVTPR
jgi:hypothetical protein